MLRLGFITESLQRDKVVAKRATEKIIDEFGGDNTGVLLHKVCANEADHVLERDTVLFRI